MLAAAAAIAFLPSTDLDRSRAFFAGTLGLTLIEQSPYACVVRAGTTMLRITLVESLHPHPFTVFGWEVPDIRGTVAALAAAGVAVLRYDGLGQDADGVWTTPNGDEIAWFADPEGNTLSLTRFVS
jgi:catechol 2,3-dioxygenase-like lactoylglutathione lyase family enzyme